MWDAQQYAKFSRERARPFFDLTAQITATEVGTVADIGCGPGDLTRTLAERWPAARVVGVDTSAEMLTRAASCAIPGRLQFIRGDIATWEPDGPLDVIVSNAALQWVADHERLLPRLVNLLAAGGTLAVQVPNRFHATPAQEAIDITVREGPWKQLEGVGLHAGSVQPLTWYVDRLHDLDLTVNAWETTYIHVLSGENPVLEWLKGTALRPLVSRLGTAEAEEFLGRLGRRLRSAYPARGRYTLFPFPRLFFAATRPT
jgi:trans-aconitate 2-methyltransferase